MTAIIDVETCNKMYMWRAGRAELQDRSLILLRVMSTVGPGDCIGMMGFK